MSKYIVELSSERGVSNTSKSIFVSAEGTLKTLNMFMLFVAVGLLGSFAAKSDVRKDAIGVVSNFGNETGHGIAGNEGPHGFTDGTRGGFAEGTRGGFRSI